MPYCEVAAKQPINTIYDRSGTRGQADPELGDPRCAGHPGRGPRLPRPARLSAGRHAIDFQGATNSLIFWLSLRKVLPLATYERRAVLKAEYEAAAHASESAFLERTGAGRYIPFSELGTLTPLGAPDSSEESSSEWESSSSQSSSESVRVAPAAVPAALAVQSHAQPPATTTTTTTTATATAQDGAKDGEAYKLPGDSTSEEASAQQQVADFAAKLAALQDPKAIEAEVGVAFQHELLTMSASDNGELSNTGTLPVFTRHDGRSMDSVMDVINNKKIIKAREIITEKWGSPTFPAELLVSSARCRRRRLAFGAAGRMEHKSGMQKLLANVPSRTLRMLRQLLLTVPRTRSLTSPNYTRPSPRPASFRIGSRGPRSSRCEIQTAHT